MSDDRRQSANPEEAPQAIPRRVIGALLVLILFCGIGAYWLFSNRTHDTTRAKIEVLAELNTAVEIPDVINPGYLGPQACAECHAKRLAEFQRTNHYRACYQPVPDEMPRGFGIEQGSFQTYLPELRFEMTRKGDNFFQTAIRRTNQGTETSEAKIALAYGVGNADSVYFSWRGKQLYELPMAWLYTSSEWGAVNFDPHDMGDFARDTTPRCMECHNTWFRHVPGTVNEYEPSTFILGVTCERCHGPARDHVAWHQAHPDVRSAHDILHPGKLERELNIAVCTQCHSNAVKNSAPANSYLPGQPLESAYKVISVHHSEDDHVANQIDSLRQSKCFQKSEMTCVTCHDPHKHAEPDTVGIVSCRKCHQPEDCRERSKLPVMVQNKCVDCHMPPELKININFATSDDRYVPPIRRFQHRIAIEHRARDTTLLKWYRQQSSPEDLAEAERLTGKLTDDWLNEADKRRGEYRFLGEIAAIREALAIAPLSKSRDRLIEAVNRKAQLDADITDASNLAAEHRVDESIERFQQVLRQKPDYAKAHSKLGLLYSMSRKMDLARQHLKLVAEYDPNDSSGYSMLGWLAYLDGKVGDAIENYRRANEIDPFHAKINYHWALAIMKSGAWNQAADRFREVLKIDPRHAGAAQGLAHSLMQMNQPQAAVPYAMLAARLTEARNPDVLLTLAKAYESADQLEQAGSVIAKATESITDATEKMRPQIKEAATRIQEKQQQKTR